MEDVQSSLENRVDVLTQSNEGLMIQNKSLEQDLSDHDWDLDEMRVDLESLRADRDWLLHVVVVRVMDKLIEHMEFIGGVSKIYHAALVVGEESECAGLKVDIDVESYDMEGSDSRSSHTSSLKYAMLAFATMDYAVILGLG